jgi:hypothetical protein
MGKFWAKKRIFRKSGSDILGKSKNQLNLKKKEYVMFKIQSFRLVKFAPVFSVLLGTAVALAQLETGSLLLSALQAVINVQPSGF